MANCPHCSETIETLSGFVPQETLERRIGAKNDEIKLLGDQIRETGTKALSFDAIVKERDQLLVEITRRDEQSARSTAMQESGLDPALLSSVETLHASACIGMDEPPTLAEWLNGAAKEHPLLADKFGRPADTNNVDQSKPDLNGARGPNLNPNPGPAQDPPKPGGKITDADVQAYFRSPEYSALDNTAKRAKVAELKAQVETQNTVQT